MQNDNDIDILILGMTRVMMIVDIIYLTYKKYNKRTILLIKNSVVAWWCHDREMLSLLLALCVGNPLNKEPPM